MAEGDEERTEQASQRRLDQAREEGDLAMSREVVGVAALGAGYLVLTALAGPLRDAFLGLIVDLPRAMLSTSPAASLAGSGYVVGLGALVLAAVALAATAAAVVQTQGGIWLEKVAPDPTRLFSTHALTKLFSKELAADVGVALAKAGAVGWVAWLAARDEFTALVTLLEKPAPQLLTGTFLPLAHVARSVVGMLVVFAAVDALLVRYRYQQKLKMTKDQIRRESKEEDGDPLLRSRRKRKHRELAKGRAKTEVPKADALLVNPTHIAIAIRYKRGEDRAPKVLAKGKGVLAELMRDLARSHGIPIVEDIPLARLLYKRVKVGREVPADTYKAVAAVLAFVYRLTRRPPTRPAPMPRPR